MKNIKNRYDLFTKGKDIIQTKGFLELIKRSFHFLVNTFFQYKIYYLYENNLDHDFEYLPRIENYTFRIISTVNDVDKIIIDGFNIESCYADIDMIKERISKGAILFSCFINMEIAHTSWIALTDDAKKDIDSLNYSIDYRNDVCAGDSRTNLKYQNLGIYNYVWSKAFLNLRERGIKKVRFAIEKNNIAPQKGQAKLGSLVYGQLKYLKLFKWKFYKQIKK